MRIGSRFQITEFNSWKHKIKFISGMFQLCGQQFQPVHLCGLPPFRPLLAGTVKLTPMEESNLLLLLCTHWQNSSAAAAEGGRLGSVQCLLYAHSGGERSLSAGNRPGSGTAVKDWRQPAVTQLLRQVPKSRYLIAVEGCGFYADWLRKNTGISPRCLRLWFTFVCITFFRRLSKLLVPVLQLKGGKK